MALAWQRLSPVKEGEANIVVPDDIKDELTGMAWRLSMSTLLTLRTYGRQLVALRDPESRSWLD